MEDALGIPEEAEEVAERARSQPHEALALANARRMAIADLSRRVKAREVNVGVLLEGLLEDEEDVLAHMRVSKLLRSIPRFGEGRVEEVLEALRIHPTKRFRELTPNQRAELTSTVRMMIGAPPT